MLPGSRQHGAGDLYVATGVHRLRAPYRSPVRGVAIRFGIGVQAIAVDLPIKSDLQRKSIFPINTLYMIVA
jgi:hypothetical protein